MIVYVRIVSFSLYYCLLSYCLILIVLLSSFLLSHSHSVEFSFPIVSFAWFLLGYVTSDRLVFSAQLSLFLQSRSHSVHVLFPSYCAIVSFCTVSFYYCLLSHCFTGIALFPRFLLSRCRFIVPHRPSRSHCIIDSSLIVSFFPHTSFISYCFVAIVIWSILLHCQAVMVMSPFLLSFPLYHCLLFHCLVFIYYCLLSVSFS